MIHLDSSLLIDLQRAELSRKPLREHDALDRLLAALLTRNVKDFSRVPGLRVLGY